MESTLQLNRGDLFKVSSWMDGIAVRFVRYAAIDLDPMDFWELACCEDEDQQHLCDHVSDMCWIYSEPEPEEDFSVAIVVMVGDDREHKVDVEDLIPIDAEQVCSCGSIGCCFGGSEQ